MPRNMLMLAWGALCQSTVLGLNAARCSRASAEGGSEKSVLKVRRLRVPQMCSVLHCVIYFTTLLHCCYQ